MKRLLLFTVLLLLLSSMAYGGQKWYWSVPIDKGVLDQKKSTYLAIPANGSLHFSLGAVIATSQQAYRNASIIFSGVESDSDDIAVIEARYDGSSAFTNSVVYRLKKGMKIRIAHPLVAERDGGPAPPLTLKFVHYARGSAQFILKTGE
ncbi:MAG: hypothetical protein WC528_03165 [Patescibacteria group bacterium]